MELQYCNDAIQRQQAAPGDATTWRRWLRQGWSLLVADCVALHELLATWQRRASMRRHLGTLDERMLKDIGLTRADVWVESRKPFWRA